MKIKFLFLLLFLVIGFLTISAQEESITPLPKINQTFKVTVNQSDEYDTVVTMRIGDPMLDKEAGNYITGADVNNRNPFDSMTIRGRTIEYIRFATYDGSLIFRLYKEPGLRASKVEISNRSIVLYFGKTKVPSRRIYVPDNCELRTIISRITKKINPRFVSLYQPDLSEIICKSQPMPPDQRRTPLF